MPGIDPEFICHHLSISPSFQSIAQRQRKLGEEKRRAAQEETNKLLAYHLVGEHSDAEEGQWEMTHVHRLHKLEQSLPKELIFVTFIDRLVDKALGSVLLRPKLPSQWIQGFSTTR
ncbi:hypothetical protein CR513_17028, partial [Mucuna pruriens]